MKTLLLMTPGPTMISQDSINETARNRTNPDLDMDFFTHYKDTANKYNKIIESKVDSFIMSGEAILGLEAACASLTESGDRVLCISNGIFGDGFADFIKIYGGEPVFFKGDRKRDIDILELENFLKKDSNFKYATLVHCETPSGITNSIEDICRLLKSYEIISVVDSVSAIAGEPVKFDEWNIDILLGGSQKCLSYIPGLTLITVSNKAWHVIESRKTPVSGFYCNLGIWKNLYETTSFPYTQSTQLIYGLNKAIDKTLSVDYVKIHKSFGEMTRKAVVSSGLELYAENGYSNTVTTIMLPKDITFNSLFEKMKSKGVLIGGGFNFLENKIFRLGHMGENNSNENLIEVMKALDESYEELGIILASSLEKNFEKQI
jgi:aspartate aminotransferase-like enzyme